jgi:oxygen-independent coproporphyrinogen-3 oxidase
MTPELLLRHSRPGPRYTSYPTVPVWENEPPDDWFLDAVQSTTGAVSVYVHLPFCKEQCTFCGCNMVVSGLRSPGTRYLDALEKQVAALPLASGRVPVVRIHLGGGTPTWHTPDELDRLFDILYRRFEPVPDAEIGVEADPDVTSDEHIERLADRGVTRISLGVQSFDAAVLKAVNRPQRGDRIGELLARARGRGMRGLNLDLMYGLPEQTVHGFRRSLDRTLAMKPDRLALFGYAHVPWLKNHQKALESYRLPEAVERAELFLEATEILQGEGFVAIGLDHFARHDDELAIAAAEGVLRRDFMGYTTRPQAPMIGLGMSAISEFPDRFVQQRGKLSQWWRAIEKGEPLLERGMRLSAEDRLRSDVIMRIMCNLVVRFEDIERAWGVNFASHFADELVRLRPLRDDGLCEIHHDRIVVPEPMRLLMRLVAMVFDAYLKDKSAGPRFSQTV